MGTLADMNNTVMYPFGSQGFVRPIAGMQRRCLDQDDLDGINFLYPWCGWEQLTEPQCEYVISDRLVGLRVFESFFKWMLLPIIVLVGSKVFAMFLLVLEDWIADWKVRRAARRLLNEAEAAEKAKHKAADTDQDGKLDFDEFTAAVREREVEGEEPASEEELRAKFNDLDKDGSGKIRYVQASHSTAAAAQPSPSHPSLSLTTTPSHPPSPLSLCVTVWRSISPRSRRAVRMAPRRAGSASRSACPSCPSERRTRCCPR